MRVVLACDLGGTNFRAALVDETGVLRAEAQHAGPPIADHADASEIDAQAWWRILLACAGRLAEAEPALFTAIEGIAICGITRTQVFLDRDGVPLRPSMSWKDIRAEAAVPRLREALATHPEARNINAFHPLARLVWLREEEPSTFARLDRVLEPKDWLNFCLTGMRATDPVSMARLLACREAQDGRDAFALAGLPETVLPPVLEAQQRIGMVRADLPMPFRQLAGVPVFCSSNDTWAAVLGLGALRAGYAYNISGTTEVLGMVSDRVAEAEGLLTVDWRGFWQLGGPSQNGADCAAWLVDLVASEGRTMPVGEAMTALLDRPRDPLPLLFLPYLQGERVPYWNPNLRGAFVGLNRRHRAVDLAHAVLEGVGFLNRIVLERAEASLGAKASELRFGGGASTNPVWCQIKADILGCPVVVGAAPEPGLLGAAMVAFAGLGRFASLGAAQAALSCIAHRFEPDPARHAQYDRICALFRRAEKALAPISIALAREVISPDDRDRIRDA